MSWEPRLDAFRVVRGEVRQHDGGDTTLAVGLSPGDCGIDTFLMNYEAVKGWGEAERIIRDEAENGCQFDEAYRLAGCQCRWMVLAFWMPTSGPTSFGPNAFGETGCMVCEGEQSWLELMDSGPGFWSSDDHL